VECDWWKELKRPSEQELGVGKRLGDRPPIAWSFGMSKKLVVVGGGAGGPSAAAKAKRLDPDLEVSVLEAGEHVSFST
jgi:hypothetical protein